MLLYYVVFPFFLELQLDFLFLHLFHILHFLPLWVTFWEIYLILSSNLLNISPVINRLLASSSNEFFNSIYHQLYFFTSWFLITYSLLSYAYFIIISFSLITSSFCFMLAIFFLMSWDLFYCIYFLGCGFCHFLDLLTLLDPHWSWDHCLHVYSIVSFSSYIFKDYIIVASPLTWKDPQLQIRA